MYSTTTINHRYLLKRTKKQILLRRNNKEFVSWNNNQFSVEFNRYLLHKKKKSLFFCVCVLNI
uniref:Uncharacterized protein n=1 Tax=Lepeophtheirus salmonis TaxID=72036 RepID=A0A0K2TXR9_LEPSM